MSLRGAFSGPEDTDDGKRPVVFDILGPDQITSILPNDLRLVLYVNPNSMSINYSKQTSVIATRGGFIEQHWGEAVQTIAIQGATGGFKRLYSGLSNTTGGGIDIGGTRRETLAYDKFLDMLALFKNNGSVYNQDGQIILQGRIKMTFDGGVYVGWFRDFTVEESAEKPFMFTYTANLEVEREVLRMRV